MDPDTQVGMVEIDTGEILQGPASVAERLWDGEPEISWRCDDCLWEIEETTHSAAYRAEEHHRHTGHRIRLRLDRWDPEEYAISLEEYLRI
jgi:hypothetical protein